MNTKISLHNLYFKLPEPIELKLMYRESFTLPKGEGWEKKLGLLLFVGKKRRKTEFIIYSVKGVVCGFNFSVVSARPEDGFWKKNPGLSRRRKIIIVIKW